MSHDDYMDGRRSREERLEAALRAFVKAEQEWSTQKRGMPPGFFDDPLADAYKQAVEALALSSETERNADSPLMEELDAITEGKSKLDLAEEIWKLRKKVEDARLSAAMHENAAGQLAQMAVDSVSPGPNCRDAALEEAATIADREWIGENSLIASRCARTIARSIRALKSSRGATGEMS